MYTPRRPSVSSVASSSVSHEGSFFCLHFFFKIMINVFVYSCHCRHRYTVSHGTLVHNWLSVHEKITGYKIKIRSTDLLNEMTKDTELGAT